MSAGIHYVDEPREGEPTTNDRAHVTCATCLRNLAVRDEEARIRAVIAAQDEADALAVGLEAAHDVGPVASRIDHAIAKVQQEIDVLGRGGTGDMHADLVRLAAWATVALRAEAREMAAKGGET